MSDRFRGARVQVCANVAIYHPVPDGIRWNQETDPKNPIYFHINNEVWFGLGNAVFDSDLNEEAAAMRQLAKIAKKVAAELERRARVAADTALTGLIENLAEKA